MPEKRTAILIVIIVILLISLPYLYAFLMSDSGAQFGGFLINPIDGHSYLAKMELGLRGEWRFDLPYTAEKGNGAYLFLFYIFLGHVSRVLGISKLLVFHGTRLISAFVLLFSIFNFSRRTFEADKDISRAFVISVLGSGLGWIAVVSGSFTSDLWVAEAYPFLSMYTNPHFTLGLALMTFLLTPKNKISPLLATGLGLLLAVIQPFSVVIVVLVLFVERLIEVVQAREQIKSVLADQRTLVLIGFGLGGVSFLAYQYLAIFADPVLSAWNVQNVTPSPGWSDLLISFSPIIFLGLFGLRSAWSNPKTRKLVIWSVISLVLIAFPWNLQRRFLTGLYLPLAGLGIIGLKAISSKLSVKPSILFSMLIILVIPTNLIVILSGVSASATQDPTIYISAEEIELLTWINGETDPDDLVVTDQRIGLYIPSQTGRRVIYGHPFETIRAEEEQRFLDEFFNQQNDVSFYQDQAAARGMDYIHLSGSPTDSMKKWLEEYQIPEVYRYGDQVLFKIGQQ